MNRRTIASKALAGVFGLLLAVAPQVGRTAEPPSAEPAPAPGPVWLEQRFAVEASLVVESSPTQVPAFQFEGVGRVLKDGFKSELVIDGTTQACDFTGQLTDSVTHVTQYYCYLGPASAIRILSERSIPASSDSMARALEVLKLYLAQDDLRSVVILIGADSDAEAFTTQTARYREPAGERRALEVQTALAPRTANYSEKL